MELNQIRYFVLTAQLQNMTKAAQRLGISQPSLSKSLSKLEADLGTVLFDRSGKKISLNEKGRRFLDGALNILQELDDTASAVSEMSRNTTSKLSLGLFRPHSLITECMADFTSICPNVEYTVNYSPGYVNHLDLDEYDMLLYPRELVFKKYKGYKVASDRYYLAVHKKNRLSGKKSLSISELAGESFIFLRFGPRNAERPYHLCASSGIPFTVRCFINSGEFHRQLISAGLGIGFISEGSANAYINDPNIVLIPVTDEEFDQEIMLGFKRDKHLSETGRLFRDFVTQKYSLTPPSDSSDL